MLFVHPSVDGHLGVRFFPPGCFDPPVLPGHLGAGLRVILTSDTGHAQFSWPLVDIHLSELSKAQLSCGDVIYRRNRTWTGEGSQPSVSVGSCRAGPWTPWVTLSLTERWLVSSRTKMSL